MGLALTVIANINDNVLRFKRHTLVKVSTGQKYDAYRFPTDAAFSFTNHRLYFICVENFVTLFLIPEKFHVTLCNFVISLFDTAIAAASNYSISQVLTFAQFRNVY